MNLIKTSIQKLQFDKNDHLKPHYVLKKQK